MKQEKTNEGLLKEVVYILLLFGAIAFLISEVVEFRGLNDEQPSLDDLRQQQEMIDYHRSQGREITVNR